MRTIKLDSNGDMHDSLSWLGFVLLGVLIGVVFAGIYLFATSASVQAFLG